MNDMKYKSVKKIYNIFDKFQTDYVMSSSDNIKRYTEWRAFTDKNKLYPTEFLLPQIVRKIKISEFPFILDLNSKNSNNLQVTKDAITNLGPWEYYIKFPNNLDTTINSTFSETTIIFHRFRSILISDTIAKILGDKIGESNILDMGCHCGVFSLDMAYRGANYVYGFDLREKNINQANYLKNIFNINNTDFIVKNIYDVDEKEYDIILCLGLMYHLTDPYSIMKFMNRNTRYFAVVDTICHKEPISALHVVCNKNTNVAIEGDESLEFHPTYRSMIDMIKESGFKEIVEVIGISDSYVDLYSDYHRRCFICFKEEGLFLLEKIKKHYI